MRKRLTAVLLLLLLAGVQPLEGVAAEKQRLKGQASWMGEDQHGKQTASGKPFDMFGFAAAHRTLPFGTVVKVTNVNNGKNVYVTICDRGPYHGDRVIDISQKAARHLGIIDAGVARVKLDVVADQTGKPVDPREGFFIRLRQVKSTADGIRLVRRLEQRGIPASRVIRRTEKGSQPFVGVGPYRRFSDVSRVAERIAREHPGVEIITASADI